MNVGDIYRNGATGFFPWRYVRDSHTDGLIVSTGESVML